ncbi:MAG TPA: SurA N-terminal domain-containing protein [Candidatus Angelobacter sp.]|nr:SurA N-terminal domain-containing protein [Candidatus Angelobacter sp.]
MTARSAAKIGEARVAVGRCAQNEEHGLKSKVKRGQSAALAVGLAGLLFLLSFGIGCNTSKNTDGIMATVNGRKIERVEVEKYYNNQTADAPQKPVDEQAETLRLNILKQLIDNEILMQRAEKLGLLATDDEVNSKLAEIKAPFSQDEFDKRMAARNITLADFKADLRRSITVDKVLNKEITSKINITDDDITAYYNQHKAEFNLIEPQYHLAQILVTTQPSPQTQNVAGKAQNPEEAKKKIQVIENRLDSGEDFASVAMALSEQPETSQNGGDLGFVPESSLKADHATYDAISKLKPGQYSPVLLVGDPNSHQILGFRVVKLISREAAGQRELKDPRVQQAIREQLRDRREQLLKAAYYEVIRDEAKIENFFAEDILKKANTTK